MDLISQSECLCRSWCDCHRSGFAWRSSQTCTPSSSRWPDPPRQPLRFVELLCRVEVNSGDDDGVPTARHNEARMLICEEQMPQGQESCAFAVRSDQELPELQESLLHQAGHLLGRRLEKRNSLCGDVVSRTFGLDHRSELKPRFLTNKCKHMECSKRKMATCHAAAPVAGANPGQVTSRATGLGVTVSGFLGNGHRSGIWQHDRH